MRGTDFNHNRKKKNIEIFSKLLNRTEYPAIKPRVFPHLPLILHIPPIPHNPPVPLFPPSSPDPSLPKRICIVLFFNVTFTLVIFFMCISHQAIKKEERHGTLWIMNKLIKSSSLFILFFKFCLLAFVCLFACLFFTLNELFSFLLEK